MKESGNGVYTVDQMIAELQKLPPDMRLLIVGCEGYWNAGPPTIQDMTQNINGEWFPSAPTPMEDVAGLAVLVRLAC
jgi:hypothetical protein